MKKRNKTREGSCIYCGTVGDMTDDHVPPKNLFPKPRLGLIKVPSCEKCNGSFKLDDEYFRLAITTGVDPKVFPIAIEAIHKLGAPERVRFAKSMLSNIDQKRDDLSLDRQRLHRVIERIIRGLLWHHQRRILPGQVQMRVWFTSFNEAPMDDLGFGGVLDTLSLQELQRISERIFSYRYLFDSDQAFCSAWYFRFYERNEVLAIVPRS